MLMAGTFFVEMLLKSFSVFLEYKILMQPCYIVTIVNYHVTNEENLFPDR